MTRTHTRPVAALVLVALTFVPATAQTARATAPSATWRIDPARSVVQFTVTNDDGRLEGEVVGRAVRIRLVAMAEREDI